MTKDELVAKLRALSLELLKLQEDCKSLDDSVSAYAEDVPEIDMLYSDSYLFELLNDSNLTILLAESADALELFSAEKEAEQEEDEDEEEDED